MMSIKNFEDPEALLMEDQAARLLSVSPRTLQAWRSEDRGPPYVRVGRSVRYVYAVLLQWIADHLCRPKD
jgi:predicted DNA-binding transcriptional regulator AlpA